MCAGVYDARLAPLLEFTRRLPPPKPPRIFTEEDVRTITCMCGHKKDRASMPLLNSGIVQFRDNVCRNCPSHPRHWATIVCYTCKEVVAKVAPERDSKDGFAFESRHVYHVQRCAYCCPELESAEVVERILFNQHNRPLRPTIFTPP